MRLMPSQYNFENFIAKFQELKNLKQDFIAVTLTKIIGSAPQEIGARILVSKGGLAWGTVGGGKIEAWAINKAQELLNPSLNSNAQPDQGLTEYHEVNLQKDIGMSCGGVVGLLFEKHLTKANLKIAVFGAGHVSQELVPLLCRLNAEVQVADPRADWLEKIPEQRNLKKIQSENLPDLVKDLAPSSFVICVTMGHAHDFPILQQALQKNFPYVGVIGSDTKAAKLRAELQSMGLTPDQIEKMICPIGESIGSNAPFEIAISILAQVMKRAQSLSKF